MKFRNVLKTTVEALAALKFGGRDPKLGKLDFAVLKIALMIAALDGEVAGDEVKTFLALAKKCRGANAKSVRAVLNEALRAAGYILILARTADERTTLSAFADEAVKMLPGSFLDGKPEDVRRAFVLWTAMCMSDGEYSEIERKAIACLQKHFTKLKTAEVEARIERDKALSPAFIVAYGGPRKTVVKLLPDGFLDSVEDTLVKAKGAAIADLVTG